MNAKDNMWLTPLHRAVASRSEVSDYRISSSPSVPRKRTILSVELGILTGEQKWLLLLMQEGYHHGTNICLSHSCVPGMALGGCLQ